MLKPQSPITNNQLSATTLPDDVVLRVDNVSKKFCRNLKRSMWYGLKDLARNFIGGSKATPSEYFVSSSEAGIENSLLTTKNAESTEKYPIVHPSSSIPHPSSDGLRPSEFWALKNISFELKRGECLGLIGQNGCGKSTLLRLIAGIFPPDDGVISRRGHIGALIALGAGFHPHLTGRENIYLNGTILGLSHKSISKKYDKIIEFADIGDFLDAPVATYSSGMRVRLGFAVAACQNPDLLLIDEILAVGDANFFQKCLDYVNEVVKGGTSIILVAHNMLTIQSMASQTILMKNGMMQALGKTADVVEVYNDSVMKTWGTQNEKAKPGEGYKCVINRVQICQNGRILERKDTIVTNSPIKVVFGITCKEEIPCGRLWMQLATRDRDVGLMGASMFEDGHYLALAKGENEIQVEFDGCALRPGVKYIMYAGLRDMTCHTMLAHSFASETIEVGGNPSTCLNGMGSAVLLGSRPNALLDTPYRWNPKAPCELK